MNAPTIITPIYNNRELMPILLKKIDLSLEPDALNANVFLVNNSSSIPVELGSLGQESYKRIKSLSILTLGRNLGHQRALAWA